MKALTLTLLILLTQSSHALDADNDGYSNWNDADFNNDGIVNFNDLSELRLIFGSTNPAGDLNGDGRVNFADVARFRALFGKPPGGTASLTWTAPTENEDGSLLTDLAGYRVYLDLSEPVVLAEVNGTYVIVDGLKSGLQIFKVTALDTSGNESVFSGTAGKNIL